MFTNRMKRGAGLVGALMLSLMLWGCGNTTPTGVDLQETLQPAGHDTPTDSSTGATESDTNKWW